jgi:phage shock protein PspC (stress-responsive transcriptional regulator)
MTTPTVTPYRQLLRPLDDRIVAGVCSGIGRYFGLDPVLIRVGFAVATVLTWGVALIAYPFAWFLIPEGSGGTPEAVLQPAAGPPASAENPGPFGDEAASL